MARIKIMMPESFSFSTEIPIRITDVNYAGHVGNDSILSIIQEARTKYLAHLGYTEINMAGAGLIMSDVAIEFKSELFYGETVSVSLKATEFSKVAFEFYYLLEKKSNDDDLKTVAHAKSGMLCFDYENKKVTSIPEIVLKKLTET